ncbi:uncharacterized protein SAPINGB_P004920 [Magnusiomyces paraingens]|uniref:Kinesin motor domain-containing protein n=1 Tax=Magnusiomyces paraingens TaxID=2606893 RepID=A0A5E8C055_9ASCO|nr:uncharacterized protein SAPINGB_P004920 [Saprochaete ingens]VVT56260.1 unnamed protein product [Saprochaete ingens]
MLYPLSQAFSFFYSVTAEPLVRRIFTPDNARRTLYVIVTAFFAILLYASAFLLYAIIYYHFIPESEVSVPLYFDYSWLAVDPYHVGAPPIVQDTFTGARGVAGTGTGHVSEDKTAQIPGPFAAIDLSATLLPLMRHSVGYRLAVDLDLPRNAHNKNLGNFMVRLAVTPNIHEFVRLHGPASSLSRGTSPRPAYVVPNKQLLYRNAGLVSRFPLTHFPETYLMDLPKLYVRGPAVHPARGGTPNSTTTLYAGVPLHAVAPSKPQQKPLVSVLATRPAILAYKPLLLEYLETLFWSPVYAVGLVSGGFSERVSLDMVDDWTRRDALEGRAGDGSGAALKTYPFSQTVLDAVGWWASSSSEYLKTKGTLFIAKFRQTDEIPAEIPRDVNSAVEQLEKNAPPPKKSIKDEFEGIVEQDFLDTEKGDGHVWAVVELDRVAHLNGALLTLHTKWSGLRYWMHRYRILLFIVGPIFLWAIECAGALLAGYLIVTLFGENSTNGLPTPPFPQNPRPARLERPPQRHASGGSSTGSSTRTHRNGSFTGSRQTPRVRRPRPITPAAAAPVISAAEPVSELEPENAPEIVSPVSPAAILDAVTVTDYVSEPEPESPTLLVAPTTPPGPVPETAPIADPPVIEALSEPSTPVAVPASCTESVASVSSSVTALSGDVEENSSEAETEHDLEIENEDEGEPENDHEHEHDHEEEEEAEPENEHEEVVEPENENESEAENETEENTSSSQSPSFDSTTIFNMLPNRSTAPPPSVTPATAHGTTSATPSPVASLRVRPFSSVSPSPSGSSSLLAGAGREENSNGDSDVSVASGSTEEVSQDETAVASGPSSRVTSKQPEELADLFNK